MSTVTIADVRAFAGQTATVHVESRDAVGEPFVMDLTGRIDVQDRWGDDLFCFDVVTGPNEGLRLTPEEVTSIVAA